MPRRRSVFAICGAVSVIGLALVLLGNSLPIYLVDDDRAHIAFASWCDAGHVDHAAGGRYLALFSWHYAVIDIGVALLLASLTIAGGAAVLRKGDTSAQGGSWLRTPRDRWKWLALGVAAIAGLHTALGLSFGTDLERQMLPACADSIGIPLSALSISTLLLTPVLLMIGFLVTLGFGALPAPLDRWDSRRPTRSWIVSVIFGTLMLVVAASMLLGAADSTSVTTPAMIVAMYLLASTRAALLMPSKCRAMPFDDYSEPREPVN